MAGSITGVPGGISARIRAAQMFNGFASELASAGDLAIVGAGSLAKLLLRVRQSLQTLGRLFTALRGGQLQPVSGFCQIKMTRQAI